MGEGEAGQEEIERENFQIELISNVASATHEACQVIGNVLNVRSSL